MAQAQPEDKRHEETQEMEGRDASASFKFNAQAPEFVPRSHAQMPISGYYYPCFQFGPDWFFIEDQEPLNLISGSNFAVSNCSKNVLTDDLRLKIVKQVEYQLGDVSLLANDTLVKHMNRDPEGYVPISVIASSKKIKSLVNNNHLLAQALRSSSKLLVSEDGKKVRRKHLFSDRDKEDVQSRTVVAENLPEDHSHQNLEKIFGVVGSVKTIRICHPQESNSSRPKSDIFISNKLHALVEYETTETAEKAVDKLNDERNWRKGLRVRLLLRRSPKSVLKSRKSDFDGIYDDDDAWGPETSEDSSQSNNIDLAAENNAEENSATSKKGWARGRGKSRGRSLSHNGRGLLAPSPQLGSSILSEASTKQVNRGPRMPDGTRGFTMGRGKPISTPALASLPSE
ncbi:la-related protein 6C [Malania oleifera]|uniref:la-related protein 6C n=1 Tax=Malania oleifera TaxID=397392 RepID=UPI0025ADF894|nr:la-related protein 6C [Malania oleifera]